MPENFLTRQPKDSAENPCDKRRRAVRRHNSELKNYHGGGAFLWTFAPEITYESSNGEERIFARIYEPVASQNARAVLQIAHGMAEYIARYEDFCRFMAAAGFVVCLNDHAGHGRSVKEGASYGYFGEGGYHNLVKDLDKLRQIVQTDYPQIPYFILGHSMDSFLVWEYHALWLGCQRGRVGWNQRGHESGRDESGATAC